MDDLMVIRPAAPGDVHGLWELRDAAIRQEAGEHYSPEQVEGWRARRTPGSYREAISQGRLRVAQSADGRLMGYAQLDPETGEVEAVYVDPECTRRGVGSCLLEALEAWARSAGRERLYLDASLNAVRFYERAGFRREHEVLYPLGNGGEFACVFMTRLL